MTALVPIDCACLKSPADLQPDEVTSRFGLVRKGCPALRLVIPDSLWTKFAAWDEKGDEDAWHRSIFVLAFERGQLKALTTPIHRLLMDGERPRSDLRRQYMRDLRESWMFLEDPAERHRRSRMFQGRIAELQCAGWLESIGWTISGLEALRVGSDIEATKDGEAFAFEVKAIGRSDDQFRSVLNSLRGQSGIRHPSPDAAANYLLFRAYEAGKQLKSHRSKRVTILAIEELAWQDFNFQLKEGWIDWSIPRFLGEDPEWENFLKSQEVRYPRIREELRPIVTSIDAIWIVQRLSGFGIRLEMAITPKAAAFGPSGGATS